MSRAERLDPHKVTPYILKLEPNLAKLLSDNVEPKDI
jgi:hypothetical protein